ncbi:hypothetical protein F2Q69_00048888 [Brassica cretica]|uniref:Uncharacterized protein n=1 Tax=Brassica cretica TaxID=69181 RepID=A0A8S9PGT2_BRACR|nr:hypothetical protein F2Q69_00048888 [Brassica cretica]
MEVAMYRAGGLTGRYVASRSKPRRVLLVFDVKSQRKLRLRRNENRYDEDSKENAKEDLFRTDRSLRSEWRVGLSSVATDRAVCVLGRYVVTELCACSVATKRLSYALAVGAVAAGVFLPVLLRTAIFSYVFPDIVLIKRFAAMS